MLSPIFALLLIINGMQTSPPAIPKVAPVDTSKLSDQEVEKAIQEGSDSIFFPEVLPRIEKREYPFLGKYVNGKERSREVLLTLLDEIGRPWCFKYYRALLNDPEPSIRVRAAQSIFQLEKVEAKKELLEEIGIQSKKRSEERQDIVSFLVLAAGYALDKAELELLLPGYAKEPDPKVREAYQQATAKLGYPKSNREIERELAAPDEEKRNEALDKVEYIAEPAWADKVKPLLLDERDVRGFHIGRRQINMRVCDYAVLTLARINPSVPFPFKVRPFPEYTEAELDQARRIYGVTPTPAKKP